jgi:hypothetical protein
VTFLPPDRNFTGTSVADHCPAGGLSIFVDLTPPVGDMGWNFTMPTRSNLNFNVYNRFVEGTWGFCMDTVNPLESTCFLTQTTTTSVNNILASTAKCFYGFSTDQV